MSLKSAAQPYTLHPELYTLHPRHPPGPLTRPRPLEAERHCLEPLSIKRHPESMSLNSRNPKQQQRLLPSHTLGVYELEDPNMARLCIPVSLYNSCKR